MSQQFTLKNFTDSFEQYLSNVCRDGSPYTIVVDRIDVQGRYNCRFSYISKEKINCNFEFTFEKNDEYIADVISVEHYNMDDLLYNNYYPKLTVISSDAKTLFTIICEHNYDVHLD